MHKKIEHKPLTLKSLIDYSVKQFSNCPSVSFVEGNPITYKELGAKIDEIAELLFSLGGYSGQNDQSSPDEIDHPHKTEPELVFSSLIAVTNL